MSVPVGLFLYISKLIQLQNPVEYLKRVRVLHKFICNVHIQYNAVLDLLISTLSQILLITEDEAVPQSFCSGDSLPIACYQYATSEASMVAKYLQSRTLSALFSPGDHEGYQ